MCVTLFNKSVMYKVTVFILQGLHLGQKQTEVWLKSKPAHSALILRQSNVAVID
jgi:hypothetical protein